MKNFKKIMDFIEDEDYHQESETGASCIGVGTLTSFFALLYNQLNEDFAPEEELRIFFKMPKDGN